jgi:hypothetical protein
MQFANPNFLGARLSFNSEGQGKDALFAKQTIRIIGSRVEDWE